MTAHDLNFLQTQSLPDLVQREILRMIKSGEIGAGAKLNEITMAQRLRVSRAPIREAFRALEEAGLVRLHKNRGVFVREVDEAEARELYELRAMMDEMAGHQLASRITEEQLAELQNWLVRLEIAAAEGITAYFPLNIAFHDRIVELTGNATLLEFYRRVIDRMHLLRRRSFETPYGSSPSRAEHGLIVSALAGRNADMAGKAMRQHVINGFARYQGAS